MAYHLDCCYKNRWQVFHLLNGDKEDSRLKNWREVDWEKVIKIEVFIRDQYYYEDILNKPSFKFFVNYRCGGFIKTWDAYHKTILSTKPIHTWVIGWSDGVRCFLQEIDFKTGLKLKDFILPVKQIEEHLHPQILRRMGKLHLITELK